MVLLAELTTVVSGIALVLSTEGSQSPGTSQLEPHCTQQLPTWIAQGDPPEQMSTSRAHTLHLLRPSLQSSCFVRLSST